MTKGEKEELVNYKFQVMEDKINAIDAKMARVLEKLDEMGGKFVSREDHEENKKRIERLEEKTNGFDQRMAWYAGA